MAQGELGGILKELGYTEDQVSSPKIPLIVIDITCTRFSNSEGDKDSIVGQMHHLLPIYILDFAQLEGTICYCFSCSSCNQLYSNKESLVFYLFYRSVHTEHSIGNGKLNAKTETGSMISVTAPLFGW